MQATLLRLIRTAASDADAHEAGAVEIEETLAHLRRAGCRAEAEALVRIVRHHRIRALELRGLVAALGGEAGPPD